MKKNGFARYLKVVVLTIVTFGLYGAWLIVTQMVEAPGEDLDGDGKNAREAQNIIAITWLNDFMK